MRLSAAGGAKGREWGDVWESQREDPAAVGQTAGSSGGERGFQWSHGHIQKEEPGRGEKTHRVTPFLYKVPHGYQCCSCCFSAQFTLFTLIFQLQAEVQRLEALKLLNICNVTEAIRSEIAVFWEKCFFSTDQRQAFAPYFSGNLLF